MSEGFKPLRTLRALGAAAFIAATPAKAEPEKIQFPTEQSAPTPDDNTEVSFSKDSAGQLTDKDYASGDAFFNEGEWKQIEQALSRNKMLPETVRRFVNAYQGLTNAVSEFDKPAIAEADYVRALEGEVKPLMLQCRAFFTKLTNWPWGPDVEKPADMSEKELEEARVEGDELIEKLLAMKNNWIAVGALNQMLQEDPNTLKLY